MSVLINSIISILAFNLLGIICLFSWVLSVHKEEIWSTIIIRSDGNE